MPIQKDLKRLVRGRMQKTGESYTAARSRILDKQSPAPAEFAKLAGMSDEAVRSKTGCTWKPYAVSSLAVPMLIVLSVMIALTSASGS